ncbi:MAG: hypothetical protein Q9225_005988 [Loekoesia sp. 1 TL-2023]
MWLEPLLLVPRSNVRERRCNRITPTQIDTNGLTHLFFAYASVDPGNFSILASHSEDVDLYKEFTARKTPTMQTWIAVGGFDFSNPGPTQQIWKLMTAKSDWRAQFITSLAKFMAHYGFQGVDLDWQYPSAGNRGGSINDAVNFVALVRDMRQAWGNKYGISATLPAEYWYLRDYDPKGMEPYLDFFGFMTYDIHGSWGSDANALGSIVRSHTDIREIQNDTVPLWFDHLDAKKINLGLSSYGRGYTLADSKCAHPGCKVVGPSKPGLCTNSAGLMSYVEISDLVKQKKLKPQIVPDTMSKQITWDDQWIGYDDDETMAMKISWASQNCFRGTMVWTVDLKAGEGSGSTPDDVGVSTRLGHLSGSAHSSGDLQTVSGHPSSSGHPSISTHPNGSTGSSKPGRPTRPSQASPESPTITKSGTVTSTTMTPGVLITEGASAVVALVPLAIGLVASLTQAQQAITTLSESKSPKADDVKHALEILTAAYSSLGILGATIPKLNANSLPQDSKPAIQNIAKNLPQIGQGTKETMTDLMSAVKDPKNMDIDDIHKANQLLGNQGSVTQ